ncbi:MAG TPA: hypothetical protein VGM44_00665 [Polyangiaceae bacterium]
MIRNWSWLLLSGALALGCGPDRPDCSGPHADFDITLRLRDRPLSADTVVHVTYGGSGMESYSPSEQGVTHEVVFCHLASLDGGLDLDDASLGAAGATSQDDSGIEALNCELWTGGYAELQITTDGLTPMTYELTPRERSCTVTQTIVLDSPDGG